MLRVVTLSVFVGLLAGCAVYTQPGPYGPYGYGPPAATYVVPAPVPVYPFWGWGRPWYGGWHRGWR
jgi:hypothetical protein